MFFKVWNESLEKVKEKLREEGDLQERKTIAQVFNNRYTYRMEYVPNMERLPGSGMYGMTPRGGYAWMCPECNKIYHPVENSVFSGMQYPACCHTPMGNRLYNDIRTS